MKVMDAGSGVFAIARSERQNFRSHLAKHGISCEVFGNSGGRWTEDGSGKASQPEEDQLKLLRSAEIEQVERLYWIWRANENGAKVYFAGMSAFGHPAGNEDAGLIQVVESPESKKQIGVATNTGKAKSGRGIYMITISGGDQQPRGDWILDNGLFVQA
jgi:hypothetical protein